jgi:PAS domain S-box-containing protein
VEARYDFVVRDGRRVAMLSTIRDITERREAERLAQSQARVLDLLEGAVIVTDGEGTIEYCNEAAERLFGRHEEVISRSIVDILPNGRGTESGGAILDCIARGERWEARLSVNGRGTVTPVMLRGNPMRDDLGRSTGTVVMSTPLAAPTGNPELPVDSGPDHADV